MDKNGVRIISLEASEIYQQIYNNGEAIGYVLPKKKSEVYFALFKNVLDYSLDLIELADAYEKKCRHKFSFEDEHKNQYTLAVINLKFNSVAKDENKVVLENCKALRERFYKDGFILGGRKYVRYKRSAGSSRGGKCLFIDERLLKHMEKWGECGLKAENGDLASWEAYKALSLSSIKGIINIPLDGILFISDCKSDFLEEVVSVKEENRELVASTQKTSITTDIWDGESLLDDTLFVGKYAEKHMLLLRNKFFKSCGFRTKLKQWFKDRNITLEDLKNRGFVTLATDINQIVMVTTPNSMKFLKFMKGGLSEKNVRKWSEHVKSEFGVVKYDKRTRFFGGEMVQSSYQFINTLGFTQEQAEELLRPSKEYLKLLRDDLDFMRYHFTNAYKRENEEWYDEEDEEISDGLAERCDVIFTLMGINNKFQETRLYYEFRNDVIKAQKDRLKQGHILLRGTNATLFGNGPEMLLALSGEFDLHNKKNAPVFLQPGEVACTKFQHGERLVGARSPHVTMGNVYCVTNNLNHDLWKYFDLGENIVCVNAINENIQQRLNGCDYDSDTMLITNDQLVVETAFRQKEEGYFKVPVCNILPKNSGVAELSELDHKTSENMVGDIINLSQRLNSILWDVLHSSLKCKDEKDVDVQKLYKNICKLAVLSGIEIDKAKRSFDNVAVATETNKISSLYKDYKQDESGKFLYPEFFKEVGKQRIDQKRKKAADKQVPDQEETAALEKKDDKQGRKYAFYHAPMEYVYKSAQDIDFRAGRAGRKKYQPISAMLRKPAPKSVSTVYEHAKRIGDICERYEKELNGYYTQLRLTKEDDEKELIYEKIKQAKSERNAKVEKELTEEYVLYLVVQKLDKGTGENWYLYAPLLQSEMFKNMLDDSKEERPKITKKTDGEIDVYGLKFTKI